MKLILYSVTSLAA